LGEILGVKVTASTYEEVASRSLEWAKRGESKAVCFSTVHMLMEAHDDPTFHATLNQMDIVNPDGMPLVWSLRALGERGATRVYGPDATEFLLQVAQDSDIPVAFYGGNEQTVEALIAEVKRRYPKLKIVFTLSPPFRPLTDVEDEEITTQISDSGARMAFIGLGCPKQERWVMDHRGRIPAVLFAVGAAFDFFAGTKAQAPRWMMRSGLEWLFRLASEPRRLAVRYLKHNPRFVALILIQLMRRRVRESLNSK
jgi:N-acetylglucosaminyldiphosphoundecaprenol N-acetyl-beta-D-mannosaminyltransferase